MKIIIVHDKDKLAQHVQDLSQELTAEILGIFPAGSTAIAAIKQLNPDLILLDPELAHRLDFSSNKSSNKASREHLSASTHHGIELLPVAAVYFFQAEHKYVIARHAGGELLITDSLAKLEKEFAELFVRIHRKYLVAKKFIQALEKVENGQWQLALTSCPDKLEVSRRKLVVVRKSINEYANS